MDDAEYLFKQDCREKKTTAYSANKKVRHTGCKFPSDFMTQREKKALNGDVYVMNIHKPINYKYFKTLPKDLQQEFLDWVVNAFGVSKKDLCKEMFKVSTISLQDYIKKVGLKSPFSRSMRTNVPYNREEWLKFLAGDDEVEELQNTYENPENDRRETNNVSDDIDVPEEVVLKRPFSMDCMNISLRDIQDWDSVVKALSAFPLPEHNTVTILIFDANEEK